MGTRPGIFAVDQGNGTPRQDIGIIESPDGRLPHNVTSQRYTRLPAGARKSYPRRGRLRRALTIFCSPRSLHAIDAYGVWRPPSFWPSTIATNVHMIRSVGSPVA